MAKLRSEEIAVYLFFENNDRPRKYVYSLYKIDVLLGRSKLSIEDGSSKLLSIEESLNEAVEMKTEILQFPAGEYPNKMGCAQLGGGGSMLYFCGGFFFYSPSLLKQPNPALKPVELLNHVFPPYIYALDAAAADAKLLKLGGQMETGKSDPIVFAAKGKIYVLSAIGDVKRQLLAWFRTHKGCFLEGDGGRGVEFLSRSVMLFECYDPVEDKSKVLPDFPLRKMSYLSGYFLLENQQKMVLTALELGFHGYSHLVYDLNQDTWLYVLNQDTCMSSSMLHRVNNLACYYVGGFCYGLMPQTLMSRSIPQKLGPFQLKRHEQEDNQPSVSAMSLVNPQDIPLVASNFNCTNMLQHLGDTSFLFVSSAQGCINDIMESEDPYAHNILITIFKDVDADAKVSTFKSKIIFSQSYVLKTNYDCLRKLRGCFHAQIPLPSFRDQGADYEQLLKDSKKDET
ncbi:hypothetical protein OROHE_016912 [Orobanche hederae]